MVSFFPCGNVWVCEASLVFFFQCLFHFSSRFIFYFLGANSTTEVVHPTPLYTSVDPKISTFRIPF